MSSKREAAYRDGFRAGLLRRCGRRPGRMFALLWLVLIVLWLVMSAMRTEVMNYPGVAPAPEAIPYADFLPGGSRSDEVMLDLDPKSLPQRDPSLKVFILRAIPPSGRDEAKPTRLAATVRRRVIFSGWPHMLFGMHLLASYDVSDPGGPFPETREDPASLEVLPTVHQLLIHRPFRGQSPDWSIAILWPEVLWGLLVLEVAAAMPVTILWFWYRRQQRRRLRAGACLRCGHLLGPAPRPEACPECGAPVDARPAKTGEQSAQPRPARTIRLFGAIVLGLAIAHGVICALVVEAEEKEVTQEWLDNVVEVFEYLKQQQGRTSLIRPANIRMATYGWPLPVVYVQTERQYEMTIGMTEPAVVTTPSPRTSPELSPPQWLHWETASTQPPVTRYWMIYTGYVLLFIFAYQAIALMLVTGWRLTARGATLIRRSLSYRESR